MGTRVKISRFRFVLFPQKIPVSFQPGYRHGRVEKAPFRKTASYFYGRPRHLNGIQQEYQRSEAVLPADKYNDLTAIHRCGRVMFCWGRPVVVYLNFCSERGLLAFKVGGEITIRHYQGKCVLGRGTVYACVCVYLQRWRKTAEITLKMRELVENFCFL